MAIVGARILAKDDGPRTLDVMSEAQPRPAVHVSESLAMDQKPHHL